MNLIRHSRFLPPAFTLIEILIAMTISSVLIAALLALTNLTTDRFAHNQSEVAHLSQTRALRQLLQADLAARLPASPLICEPDPDLEGSDRIAFIHTVSPTSQNPLHPGDLATSAYYLAFTADADGNESPKLFRKILTPLETQQLIEAGDQADFPEPSLGADEVIAYHIIAFRASPKFRSPETGELLRWQPASVHPISAVEITITQLSEAASRRFNQREQWQRIAIAPSESERPLIRTFTCLIGLSH